jgi:hypothetical protein
VSGMNAEFEIYAEDAATFRRSGRGKDFSVGIMPPAVKEPEPVAVQEPEPFRAPEPQMTEIIDLDDVAKAERGIVPPALVETEPPFEVVKPPVEEDFQPLADVEAMVEIEKGFQPVSKLESASRFVEMLELEGWTVGLLAEAEMSDLTPYPGIGPATARAIVEEAKALVG